MADDVRATAHLRAARAGGPPPRRTPARRFVPVAGGPAAAAAPEAAAGPPAHATRLRVDVDAADEEIGRRVREVFGGPDLFPHQACLVTKMAAREAQPLEGIVGGILHAEMGLGKTVSTIVHSLNEWLRDEERGGDIPIRATLVVASKTVMGVWRSQFEEHFPNVSVLYMHKDHIEATRLTGVDAPAEVNAVARRHVRGAHFVVTTYDMLMSAFKSAPEVEAQCAVGPAWSPVTALRRGAVCDAPAEMGRRLLMFVPWRRVVFDESQVFANFKTTLWHAAMALPGGARWCLTGTPIRNYDTDMWSQLRAVGMSTQSLNQPKKWRKGWVLALRGPVRAAVLSMTYEDAQVRLPDMDEVKVMVALSPPERAAYDKVLGMVQAAFMDVCRGIGSYACVLALFTALRMCTVAPHMLIPEGKRNGLASVDLAEYVSQASDWLKDRAGTAGRRSAKIAAVVDAVRAVPRGEKVVVFSMFTSVLDLVEEELMARMEADPPAERRGLVMVDGTVVGEDRLARIRAFQAPLPPPGEEGWEHRPPEVLLMTYKVGAEGLNLTAANNVCCVEPWWTNAVHRQAIARCWRIGQQRRVRVTTVYGEQTIERRILDICEQKDNLTAAQLGGTPAAPAARGGMGMDAMRDILFG